MTQPGSRPLVSIGIPVYNGEKYIAEALESVLKQTYPHWECHVINNASTDKTADIVTSMAKADPRIILHSYTDFFPIVDNWNRTALHISEGAAYYKLLQADDWITPACLEDMVDVMERYPSVGICSSYRIDGNVVNCDGLDYYQGQFYNGKEMLIRHLKEEIDITGSATTLMYRVESLQQLSCFPEIFDPKDFHCDTQLAFDIMNISDAGFVFKVLSYTRWHPGAYTSSICVVCNTFYHGKELRLFKFRGLGPDIERDYRKHRYEYAYFMMKRRLRGDKKCLDWHNTRITRRFTAAENFMALWTLNPLNYRIFKLLKKLKILKTK